MTCRDVRGFVAETPAMFPKRQAEMPQPFLGRKRVQTYVDNMRAFIRLLRYQPALASLWPPTLAIVALTKRRDLEILKGVSMHVIRLVVCSRSSSRRHDAAIELVAALPSHVLLALTASN